jgi:hypothetical protein
VADYGLQNLSLKCQGWEAGSVIKGLLTLLSQTGTLLIKKVVDCEWSAAAVIGLSKLSRNNIKGVYSSCFFSRLLHPYRCTVLQLGKTPNCLYSYGQLGSIYGQLGSLAQQGQNHQNQPAQQLELEAVTGHSCHHSSINV